MERSPCFAPVVVWSIPACAGELEVPPAVVSDVRRGERVEVVDAGEDGPVVVRSAEPQPELPIVLTEPSFVALEGAPPETARAAVRRHVGSEGFMRFASGRTAAPGEERAVALIDAARAAAVGFGEDAQVVRLSADTVRTHPRFRGFGAADWLRVQRIVDEGAVMREGAHRTLWIEDDGQLWMTVLKRARHGEIYQSSYRRSNRHDLKRLQRRRGK